MILFAIATNLVYSMGSNSHGQLGIGELHTETKYSPTLLESLLVQSGRLAFADVQCGSQHALLLGEDTDSGEARVFAWGNNESGQCGVGAASAGNAAGSQPGVQANAGERRLASNSMILVTPRLVSWQSFKSAIGQIECGAQHSAMIDKQGNLYCCGRNEFG